MASGPRADVVQLGVVAAYHCYSRCVRRAFLLGYDKLTGIDYTPRRQWLLDMQRQLAALFAIDIGFHAEMATHIHLVLRTRPDVAETWSDEDVVRRWLTITKLAKSRDGSVVEPSRVRMAIELNLPGRVKKLRQRLSNPSWFMGILCEYVARRCNREDDCRGVFWEDRYECEALLDEPSILVCGIYVDLNQIRAGEALTPEESTHTSAYDRIRARQLQLTAAKAAALETPVPETASAHETESRQRSPDEWLCRLTIDEREPVNSEAMTRSATGSRASDKGLLPISLDDYLRLLDASGRIAREGKGAIPADLAPIVERLGVRSGMWSDLVNRYDQMFGKFIGSSRQLVERVKQSGRRWCRGITNCSAAFD